MIISRRLAAAVILLLIIIMPHHYHHHRQQHNNMQMQWSPGWAKSLLLNSSQRSGCGKSESQMLGKKTFELQCALKSTTTTTTTTNLPFLFYISFSPYYKPTTRSWSDYEDQFLRRAVALHGENNFKFIAENIFNNTRNESQCKNRWKKVCRL